MNATAGGGLIMMMMIIIIILRLAPPGSYQTIEMKKNRKTTSAQLVLGLRTSGLSTFDPPSASPRLVVDTSRAFASPSLLLEHAHIVHGEHCCRAYTIP